MTAPTDQGIIAVRISQGKPTKIYQLWRCIKKRCKSASFHESASTYIGCSMHPHFEDFNLFHSWVIKQYGHDLPDWQLDKDILSPGNKVYGPNTCAFVPRHINSIFSKIKPRPGKHPIGVRNTGRLVKPFTALFQFLGNAYEIGRFDTESEAESAYNREKELAIRSLAEKYKSVLRPDVYAAMMAFKIN